MRERNLDKWSNTQSFDSIQDILQNWLFRETSRIFHHASGCSLIFKIVFGLFLLDFSCLGCSIMGHDCFLCGRSARESRSLYMTIDCDEQERRIRNGYLKRYGVGIAGSLIEKEVHRKCYRSIIHTQQLARYRSTSNPRKYSRRSKKTSSLSKSTDMVDADKPVNSVRRCLSLSVSDEQEVKPTERWCERQSSPLILELWPNWAC